jgi:hypothetical protein
MWVDGLWIRKYETVSQAIAAAEKVLPGRKRRRDDPRWQAMIEVAEFVESDPEPIWEFVCRWGHHKQEDLRDAVACVLLEHLLEFHFKQVFPLVETRAANDPLFADMFCRCWKFGQSEKPRNSKRFDELRARVMKGSKGAKSKRRG